MRRDGEVHLLGWSKEKISDLFWVGNDKGMGDVGILLAEKRVEAIFDAKRTSDRIMLIKLVVGKSIVTVVGLCSTGWSWG